MELDAARSALRVAVQNRPPLVDVAPPHRAGGRPTFDGFLVRLWRLMAEDANVTRPSELFVPPGDLAGGRLVRDGRDGGGDGGGAHWTGMMGLITGPPGAQRADAVLYPLVLTDERARYVSYTQPYLDVGFSTVVLKQQPHQVSPFLFASPYSGTAWLAIFGALLATIAALLVTDGVTRHARLRAVERVHGVQRARRLDLGFNRGQAPAHLVYDASCVLVRTRPLPIPPSWSTRAVLLGWAAFTVIIMAEYTANLTAALTLSQLAPPHRTLGDLALDPEVRFAVAANSSVEAYFRSSRDRLARSLEDRMVSYPNDAAAVAAVRDPKDDVNAAMLEHHVAVWWASQPPCDLTLGGEFSGTGALVIAFPKNSPLAERMGASLMRLKGDGTVAEMRRQMLSTTTTACGGGGGGGGGGGAAGRKTAAKPLGPGEIWGLFILLAVGMAVGGLVALGEVVWFRRFYQGKARRPARLARLREVVRGTPASLARHEREEAERDEEAGAAGGGGGGGKKG
jgi:hypothetical protein